MDDHPRHSAVLRYSTLWREKLGCNQIPFFWTLSVTAWGWHIRIHDVIRHDVFHNICWRMLMIVKRCDEFKSVCARSQCCGPRTHTHCRWICNISCVCWHNVVKFLHRHIWTDIERHAHTRPQTHTDMPFSFPNVFDWSVARVTNLYQYHTNPTTFVSFITKASQEAG